MEENKIKYLYKVYYNLLIMEGIRSKMTLITNKLFGEDSMEKQLLLEDIKELHGCIAIIMELLKENLETEDEDEVVKKVQEYVLEDPYFGLVNQMFSYAAESENKFNIN